MQAAATPMTNHAVGNKQYYLSLIDLRQLLGDIQKLKVLDRRAWFCVRIVFSSVHASAN